VVVDEVHALAESKRGDQLMLGLARLRRLAPACAASACRPRSRTRALARFLGAHAGAAGRPRAGPDIAMLETAAPRPGRAAAGATCHPAILTKVAAPPHHAGLHNTRAQAELFFRDLWLANDDGLPIGIHHGSWRASSAEGVEAAMAEGQLRAVVCTGSLDLGIDWGDVDLVIQVGAPKNVKRLVQRIGRANHRYNAPSKALMVPANRFEVVECRPRCRPCARMIWTANRAAPGRWTCSASTS
jgi:ATP-dependent helicase Lhr and Lhr-like helicase